jgi:hypothetical protein
MTDALSPANLPEAKISENIPVESNTQPIASAFVVQFPRTMNSIREQLTMRPRLPRLCRSRPEIKQEILGLA